MIRKTNTRHGTHYPVTVRFSLYAKSTRSHIKRKRISACRLRVSPVANEAVQVDLLLDLMLRAARAARRVGLTEAEDRLPPRRMGSARLEHAHGRLLLEARLQRVLDDGLLKIEPALAEHGVVGDVEEQRAARLEAVEAVGGGEEDR